MSDNRHVSVTPPSSVDAEIFLRSFYGEDRLSHPFRYELDLLSPTCNIAFDDMMGQDKSITVQLSLPNDETRYFNGHVARLIQTGGVGSLFHYRATVLPKLWFMTRKANCRIFQKSDCPTILDVVLLVLEENAIEIENRLDTARYRPWEYCVQYRESDFSFISRIMEQHGIYYYFEHTAEGHTMILCDSPARHEPFPNYQVRDNLAVGDIPYGSGQQGGELDQIDDWIIDKEMQTETIALGDFDFKNPVPVNVQSRNEGDFADAGTEIYDYPGEFTDPYTDAYADHSSHGENYAQARVQQLRAEAEIFRGRGDARGIGPGYKFKLIGNTRGDEDIEYLAVSATYQIDAGAFEAGESSGGADTAFLCDFTAIDASVQYRPPRITAKPIVQGPQTAVVVGDEDIDVDQYGRVHVQFHWDRVGQQNRDSSCWVRVSQAWAGAEWGSMHIPHAGHEVIVEFLEGDPDRPIITGRVYNAQNMPPESLPGNKTHSSIRDHGDNQMIMDGADGAQFIHMQQACGNEMRMEHQGPNIEIDQECGNEVLIHDGEGIQIRDSYGNEVVLDSAAGTIRIYCPTHESEMVLGKSVEIKSTSNLIEQFKGMKASDIVGNLEIKGGADMMNFFMGMKHETNLGIKSEFVGGIKNDMMKGATIATHSGPAYEFKSTSDNEKSPTIREQIGVVTSAVRDMSRQVSGSYKVRGAAKLEQQASKLEQTGDETFVKMGGEYMLKSEACRLKASNMMQKATTLKQQCDNIRATGKLDVQRGTFKVS